MKTPYLLLAPLSLLLLTGCFNEPTPAYKVVKEGQRVYLSDQGLTSLAGVTLKTEVVDYVNLDRNRLSVFPAELLACRGLKWLRLNDNALDRLPPGVAELKALRRVYLKNNKFTVVPEVLKELPELTDIDLSGNPVTEVPDWLARKKGLENLSFSRTLLTRLPADLAAWKSLHALQLGDLHLSGEEMHRIRKELPGVAIVF